MSVNVREKNQEVEFYSTQEGRGLRVRSPNLIAEEIELCVSFAKARPKAYPSLVSPRFLALPKTASRALRKRSDLLLSTLRKND